MANVPDGGWPLPGYPHGREMTTEQAAEWITRIVPMQVYFGERLPRLAPEAWAEITTGPLVTEAVAVLRRQEEGDSSIAPGWFEDYVRGIAWGWARHHWVGTDWVAITAAWTLIRATMADMFGDTLPETFPVDWGFRVTETDGPEMQWLRYTPKMIQSFTVEAAISPQDWDAAVEPLSNFRERMISLFAANLDIAIAQQLGDERPVGPPVSIDDHRQGIDWLIEVHCAGRSFLQVKDLLDARLKARQDEWDRLKGSGDAVFLPKRPVKAPSDRTIRRSVDEAAMLLGIPQPEDYAAVQRQRKMDQRRSAI